MLFAGLQCYKTVRLQRLCLASSLMRVQLHIIRFIFLLGCSGSAVADYKDDIGFARLLDELGVAAIPNGNGVAVSKAEAPACETCPYMPDRINNVQFAGKTITNVTNINSSVSNHANGVGNLFYGNSSSIAPQIDTINVYNVNYWLGGNYLRATQGSSEPVAVPDRIANHSWVANFTDDTIDVDILKRVDWVIENDEFIQVVGLQNGTSTNSPMLSAAFNVIAVGVTDGIHGRSTPSLDATYVSGRTRPDLVAPFAYTSSSTPVIAAAAALLVGVGHDTPSLSSAPATSNRLGNTVYTAERSEVVKAVLMAGADRVTDNSVQPVDTTAKDITDYRVAQANQSANGLDIRFGAGQVNIYNSFHILMAGEQNSLEDDSGNSGSIGLHGFDYDPSFGGAGNGSGSNVTGSYYFSTGAEPAMLTATLAWNVDVADGRRNAFPGAATLYDMDLRLYDETAGGPMLVVASASTIENTENIWVQLEAGKNYLLEVTPKTGQVAFEWDYAIAWQLTELAGLIDTDDDGIPDIQDADDDNDGLLDVDEVTQYDTDPLLADTDGDGFDDAKELAYGSDPTSDGSNSTPADNVNNNGDIDGDSMVNVVDILLATRMVLGELEPTPEQRVRADMVPDGVINAGDLLRIQQQALGL